MTLAWVVGAGGLLGSALVRALRRSGALLFTPRDAFAWTCEDALAEQLIAAVGEFERRGTSATRWEIYWAAGIGTMASTDEALASETRALARLLDRLGSSRALMSMRGAFGFASSAGAIYAGATDDVIDEHTAVAPTTPYARAKLEHESRVSAFARANPNTAALLARMSTLYGTGQSRAKPQGLLTHIARAILLNRPIRIYVPFDTIRDYIRADDAAASMVAAMRATERAPEAALEAIVRIIASETPTTIAEIIAIFNRVSRRHPRVVTSTSALASVYPARLRFRSRFAAAPQRTSFLVGVAQLLAAERLSFAAADAAMGRGSRSIGESGASARRPT